MTLLFLLLNFAVLIWSANRLILSTLGISFYYGIQPLWLSFTLVALGISLPEIFIAINASLEGANNLAIANAIGTNIANIGLVLGLTAFFRPLLLQSIFFKREYPLLFLTMLFAYSLMIDGYLGILDGCLLLLAFLLLLGYLIFTTKSFHSTKYSSKYVQPFLLKKYSIKLHIVSFIITSLLLIISSHFFIKNCIALGQWLGLSDLFIGLTIIALGTSLPELVTALIAIKKGVSDIAIGTILGSNMFNLLTILIFPSLINPHAFNLTLLWRDIPVMFAITIIFFWISYHNKKVHRWQGGTLLLIYGCYMASLFISAGFN